MSLVNFATDVNDILLDVYARSVVYTAMVSSPVSAPRTIKGIFDRHHEVILQEVKGSELDAPGVSTTMPVLTVRLADLPAAPLMGDRVGIDAETFRVWDIQPDGQGQADLIMRLVT